jgi:hypothetical protein
VYSVFSKRQKSPLANQVAFKIKKNPGCWRLTPVILATQEAEIRRIVV